MATAIKAASQALMIYKYLSEEAVVRSVFLVDRYDLFD